MLPGEVIWFVQGLLRHYDASITISMNLKDRDAYNAMPLHPLSVT